VAIGSEADAGFEAGSREEGEIAVTSDNVHGHRLGPFESSRAEEASLPLLLLPCLGSFAYPLHLQEEAGRKEGYSVGSPELRRSLFLCFSRTIARDCPARPSVHQYAHHPSERKETCLIRTLLPRLLEASNPPSPSSHTSSTAVLLSSSLPLSSSTLFHPALPFIFCSSSSSAKHWRNVTLRSYLFHFAGKCRSSASVQMNLHSCAENVFGIIGNTDRYCAEDPFPIV
jgi:hypothetical protein